MKLGIVILAAGQGTRMKSRLPKVLHPLAGKPLLAHVMDTASSLEPDSMVVVYGHGGEQVREALDAPGLQWVEQAEQLGTGHAVQQALPALKDLDRVLILYGDVPLMRRKSLQSLVAKAGSGFGLMTMNLNDPTGYGRILRNEQGQVQGIVEQKDATPEQLQICEVNTGIMLVDARSLEAWLEQITPKNAQGEYYLTDIVALAVAQGVEIAVAQPAEAVEAEGVNDRLQLAALERVYQRWQAEALMRDGVTLKDPSRFDLRGSLTTGMDVSLDVNVLIEGDVSLGDNVSVGANTVLRNVRVGDNVLIRENCVIEEAILGPDSAIGPFSRIRPGTELVGGAHVGNFVEIKNSSIGLGSKVNHLTYIGDTLMGAGVNIGAGTITCNYDGAYKHRTTIEDKAFIGSNTALVAPVTVGEDATIGAGSVIAKDAPAGELTLARGKQVTIKGWKRPKKGA
ncbi:bifunctional UDP-N-acetylglucosamine diphosphorylase/glucosamine-1-phosphate N-acetyltransferase GlmU [Thiolapillus sp.]